MYIKIQALARFNNIYIKQQVYNLWNLKYDIHFKCRRLFTTSGDQETNAWWQDSHIPFGRDMVET